VVNNNHGYEFEREVNQELIRLSSKVKGFYKHRLYDTKSFRRASEKLCCIEQPCDYLVVFRGDIYFLELKSCKKDNFPWANIKPHQIAALTESSKAGVKSYFIFNDRRVPHHFKAYATKISDFLSMYASSCKPEVSWEVIKSVSYEIPRIGTDWNMEGFFGIY